MVAAGAAAALLAAGLACRGECAPGSPLVLSGEHVTVTCSPGEAALGRRIQETAEAAWKAQSDQLGLASEGTAAILVPPDQESFRAATRGAVPEWGAAVAYPEEGFIVLRPPRNAREELDRDEVVRHEVAHVLVARATGHAALPMWFQEGLAVWLSRRWTVAQRVELLWSAATGAVVPLGALTERFPASGRRASAAYLESYSVIEYVARELGPGGVGQLLARVRELRDLERALLATGGWDLERLEWEWREDLTRRTRTVALLTLSFPLWGLAAGLVLAAFIRRRLQAAAARRREEELWT